MDQRNAENRVNSAQAGNLLKMSANKMASGSCGSIFIVSMAYRQPW